MTAISFNNVCDSTTKLCPDCTIVFTVSAGGIRGADGVDVAADSPDSFFGVSGAFSTFGVVGASFFGDFFDENMLVGTACVGCEDVLKVRTGIFFFVTSMS